LITGASVTSGAAGELAFIFAYAHLYMLVYISDTDQIYVT